ncbi:hypothetical protein, partial [Escherichia coli]|uniref:hypothetical protein n=1 Tax=Escherichia coli TaxID=562 RepID=UPI001BAFD072
MWGLHCPKKKKKKKKNKKKKEKKKKGKKKKKKHKEKEKKGGGKKGGKSPKLWGRGGRGVVLYIEGIANAPSGAFFVDSVKTVR